MPDKGAVPVQAESKGCFSEQYKKQVSKPGIEINREWLCYSAKLDKVYCQSCPLFAVGCNASISNTIASGYDDTGGIQVVQSRYQESKAH
jgi:hypothetical protein